MNPELIFSGLILALGVWQLISLEKAKKKTREKAAERAAARKDPS